MIYAILASVIATIAIYMTLDGLAFKEPYLGTIRVLLLLAIILWLARLSGIAIHKAI